MLTKLGKYEITAELGSGAMGVVYKAEDPRLGRSVALKTMSAHLASNPDLVKRFYREARAAGQLHHPNIVTIYEIDEADGIPFIAMEYLEGDDLDKIITARKPLTVFKKVDVIIQTCRGLHYAHQRGIVHRDVKPGNIVVLTDGMVKIVDFGIARIGDASMTSTGMVLGTVMYMSPEQVRAQNLDARSDVFALGLVLFELLTFQAAFQGPDVPSIIYKILNEAPEPLSKFLTNCPPELERIINKALEKNREHRYQSAEDLAFDLQRVADVARRDMVEVYLAQGQRSIRDANLTVAKESLQKVLEIDSNHDLAKTLLNQVQDQLYSKQRDQKIEYGLREAKEALEAERFEAAVAQIEEILRIDPEHKEALQLKDLVIERGERKEKITEFMERAERLAAEADYPGAKAELEAVLKLDSEHTAARGMLAWVTKELAEQERLRQVRQNVEAARKHFTEKNHAHALELLAKARELDPANVEVESLTRLIRSSQEKEERQQLLLQQLAAIQEALNREELEQAVALAEKALQDFPDNPLVVKLHTQAVRRGEVFKKRRFVDEQLQSAREALQKNEFSLAIAVLERALQTVPEDARLLSFLKSVQEARETAELEGVRRQAVHEANEMIRAGKFEGAIETLEKATARAGLSPELSELLEFARNQQEEQQKQERVHQVLSRAQAALKEQSFEEAIGILERAQRESPSQEVSSFLATARDQHQKFEQRREDLLQQALKLIEAREAAKAVALLDGADKAYFKDEKFQQLYARCREGLDRATFIRTALEQAQKSAGQGDLAQAEVLLQQALQRFSDDPTLLAAQKRLREEQARRQQLQWTKVLDEARVLMGRMEYNKAIEHLSAVSWESAGVPELAAQAKSLVEEAQRRLQEQKQKFEQRRQEIIQQAQQLLQARAPAKAIAVLDAADKAYFKDEGFQRVYAQCREAVERAKFVTGAVEKIEKSIADKDLDRAEGLLKQALQACPGEPTLLAVQKRVQEEQVRQSRQEYAQVLDDARVAMGRMDFTQATELLLTIPADFSDAQLVAEAKALQQEAERRAREVAEREAQLQRAGTGPVPVVKKPPRRPAVRPAPVAVPEKRPMALWVGGVVVALIIVAAVVWHFTGSTAPPAAGYVHLTAVPWAQVASVQTAKGERLNASGQTPLRLELPAGEYVIELKSENAVQKMNVVVNAGEVSKVNYTFPGVKVDALVDELVSKY